MLNSFYIIQEGLLTLPILYLSRYIIRNRAEYYRRLLAVTRDEDWQEWVLYILTAVERTARWTLGVIGAVQDLEEQTAEIIRRDEPKLYSHELVKLLFRQPNCRINSLVEAGIAKRQTASIYLQRIAAMGLLEERKRGRAKMFVNVGLLRLLESDVQGGGNA